MYPQGGNAKISPSVVLRLPEPRQKQILIEHHVWARAEVADDYAMAPSATELAGDHKVLLPEGAAVRFKIQ